VKNTKRQHCRHK